MESPRPAQQEIETIELADYLRVLRERKWVVLLTTLVVVFAVLLISFLQTPRYRASAKILYNKTNFETALFDMPLFQTRNQERDIQTGASLVKVDAVAQGVRTELGTDRDVDELVDMVTVEPQGATDVIAISAVSADPEEAAAVAQSFATQFIEFRRDTDRAAIIDARDQVGEQMEALTAEERRSEYGLMLREKFESLQILEQFQDGGFRLVQPADVPEAAFSPQPLRNGVLALVVGLVLGVGLAFLLAYLDRRLKDEEALERAFQLPVLASVPALGGRWLRKREDLGLRSDLPVGFPDRSSPLLEPFRVLRSNLQFLNYDGNLKVILITSGLPQQGKSITSINLSVSLALSGHRVLLLEADLRRPMLHEYLGLDNQIGATSVLSGQQTFSEAIQLVRTDEFAPEAPGRRGGTRLQKNMYALTSGPVPPNPAELVGSDRMEDLLERAREAADYVIVDSPPILLASDALNLAKYCDGIILATRVNETTRDDAREIRAILGRSGARILGLVAGGVRLDKQKYYSYGSYSAPVAGEPETQNLG